MGDEDVMPRNGHAEWGNPLSWKVDGAGRPIYDADGDGVEDNVEKTREELDRFYLPNNFFPTEDIYNTHHGNLPGHVRKAEYMSRPDYLSPHFHPELSDGRFRTNAGLDSRGDGTYADVFHQNGKPEDAPEGPTLSLMQRQRYAVPDIHQKDDLRMR